MLIGLTGAAGAGKDTAADILESAGWARCAFADALRGEVIYAYRVDPRALNRRDTKEQPVPALAIARASNASWRHHCTEQGLDAHAPRSARWTLQQWGEWRRGIRPDHWVRPVLAWVQMQRLYAAGVGVQVITDVRHANEAEALRALGGLIVRVHRLDNTTRLADDTALHASEQHLQIRADADVHNDSTRDALASELLRVLEQLASATTPPEQPA